MATVTELKNGMWLIHWFTNASGPAETVNCGQTSLQLKSSLDILAQEIYLNFHCVNVPKEEVTSSTDTCKPRTALPLKVYATYNGEMREMTRSRGQWAEVSWKFVAEKIIQKYQNIL